MNNVSGLIDPWMMDEPASAPRDPGRRIAITPGVIAQDEAQRKLRESRGVTWKRPAPVAAAEPSPIAMVRTLTNRAPRRNGVEQERYSNCAWCDVRLSQQEMAEHRRVCAERPR